MTSRSSALWSGSSATCSTQSPTSASPSLDLPSKRCISPFETAQRGQCYGIGPAHHAGLCTPACRTKPATLAANLLSLRLLLLLRLQLLRVQLLRLLLRLLLLLLRRLLRLLLQCRTRPTLGIRLLLMYAKACLVTAPSASCTTPRQGKLS
jgi:hypothetical protein